MDRLNKILSLLLTICIDLLLFMIIIHLTIYISYTVLIEYTKPLLTKGFIDDIIIFNKIISGTDIQFAIVCFIPILIAMCTVMFIQKSSLYKKIVLIIENL